MTNITTNQTRTKSFIAKSMPPANVLCHRMGADYHTGNIPDFDQGFPGVRTTPAWRNAMLLRASAVFTGCAFFVCNRFVAIEGLAIPRQRRKGTLKLPEEGEGVTLPLPVAVSVVCGPCESITLDMVPSKNGDPAGPNPVLSCPKAG